MIKIGFDLDHTILDYSDYINEYSIGKYGKKIKSKNYMKNYIKRNYSNLTWVNFQRKMYSDLRTFKIDRYFFLLINKLKNIDCEFYLISQRKNHNSIKLKNIGKIIVKKKLNFFKKTYFVDTIDDKVTLINKLKIDFYFDDLGNIVNKINSYGNTKGLLLNNLGYYNWEYYYNNFKI